MILSCPDKCKIHHSAFLPAARRLSSKAQRIDLLRSAGPMPDHIQLLDLLRGILLPVQSLRFPQWLYHHQSLPTRDSLHTLAPVQLQAKTRCLTVILLNELWMTFVHNTFSGHTSKCYEHPQSKFEGMQARHISFHGEVGKMPFVLVA